MDFHEHAIVVDQLQTIYAPPETALLFNELLDKIDGGKTKTVPVKRKSVWWFK